MSLNIPDKTLRSIKVGTLRAELGIEEFTPRKRAIFINVISGKSRTSSDAYIKVLRYYDVPYMSGGCLIGMPLPVSYLETLTKALDYELLISNNPRRIAQVTEAKKYIDSLEEGDIMDYVPGVMRYISWEKNPIVNDYCVPIPKDNPIWEIINKLKQGENPTIYI